MCKLQKKKTYHPWYVFFNAHMDQADFFIEV